MRENEYERFCAFYSKPSDEEIAHMRKDGWEPCGAPESVIGRDLQKEPTYPHSVFYFGKKKV